MQQQFEHALVTWATLGDREGFHIITPDPLVFVARGEVDALDQMGQWGWELVAVCVVPMIGHDDDWRTRLYFKRPIPRYVKNPRFLID